MSRRIPYRRCPECGGMKAVKQDGFCKICGKKTKQDTLTRRRIGSWKVVL